MKKITTKLLKILLVMIIGFSSIFNGTCVQAMETIKKLMDEENVEKVYSEEFLTEEEANEARLEKIAELEAIKEEKEAAEIEFLYYVSKLEKDTKVVPTTIEDLKESISSYTSTEVIKTSIELDEAKEKLINSYASLNDENNIYNVTITVESMNNPVKVGTEYEPVVYDTLEQALAAIGDKDLEYVEIYDETENVYISVNMECTGSVDCNNKKAELENNVNYVNVVVNPVATKGEPVIETFTFEGFENKSFVNDEAAAVEYVNELKAAILKYISDNAVNTELQEVKFTVDLDNILTTSTETVYKVTGLEGTYKSEEAAREAVTNYVNGLKESNELVNVLESLKDENITINENFVEKVTVSTLFDSDTAAMNYFNSLTDDNYTLKNPNATGIDQITTSDSSSSTTGGTSTTSETWGHLDINATAPIRIMASDGKTVVDTIDGDVKLTKVLINNSKEVSYESKSSTDENRDAEEFTSVERNKLGVKSGDTVTITGTVTYTYNGQTKTLNFTYTGKLLSQNNLCEGKGDAKGFDLSVSSFNVTTDGKVIVKVETKYQLTYEKYNYTASVNVASDEITYEVVVPEITKTTTNTRYSLVGGYYEKGYDYEVTFPIDVMEDRFSFSALISHKSKPATKEIDIFSFYTQTLEVLPKGGDVDTNETPVEEAPVTGNTNNYVGLIAVALLVLIKKIAK